MSSTVPPGPPLILGFADRRDGQGRYPVTDRSGSVIATVTKRWASNRFAAHDHEDRLLCSGGLRVFGGWTAEDDGGREVAYIGRGLFRVHRLLLRGGSVTGTLRGALFGRDWEVLDHSGRTLVCAVPHEAGWLFAPDAWLVSSVLTLAETVAITQLDRLDVKRRRNSAG